ncbi:hypothetical protein [Corallococcus exercitus]|uniref:Uncharacterized protein n=1 Tax=Corallococcus exercitus TaxID=2316736 RepID=A0A7Y4NFL7_9BACT|nr:hypothetical protein [Corallococcus exercitus]NOK11636.1 hypothetical protein [Corallococcus exercitus]
MAKAMGGDLMLQMLSELRELQEESKEQYARTQKTLQVVDMKCRVLFKRSQVMAHQLRVLSQEMDAFRDNMGEFVTHLSTLAKEVDGVKLNQTKIFSQMSRALNHLADAQASDRKRIDVLEERMDDPGEN